MKKFLLKILSFILKKEAQLIVRKYRPTIIGITGNVGKTSTKTAIYEVLKTEKNVRTAVKNFNNELGLPAVIISEKESDYSFLYWLKTAIYGLVQIIFKNKNYPEILILEYGVDVPSDMDRLLEIATPQIGVITPIGEIPVHIEFFENRLALVKEKAKMIGSLPATGIAILNSDSIDLDFFQEKSKAYIITYGFSKNANIKIKDFETEINYKENKIFTSFKISYNGSSYEIKLENIVGKSASYAIAAAFTVGLTFGMTPQKIVENICAHYKNPPGRENIIYGIKDSFILDDTYNASPQAMEEALHTLNTLNAKRKIAVLGDMLELGIHTLEAHEKIGKEAAKIVNLLITVGVRGKLIAEAAKKNGLDKKNIYSFDTLEETAAFLQKIIKKDDLILIKGSQAVRMEKITKSIMLEPEKAKEFLVRQSPKWLAKAGLYD